MLNRTTKIFDFTDHLVPICQDLNISYLDLHQTGFDGRVTQLSSNGAVWYIVPQFITDVNYKGYSTKEILEALPKKYYIESSDMIILRDEFISMNFNSRFTKLFGRDANRAGNIDKHLFDLTDARYSQGLPAFTAEEITQEIINYWRADRKQRIEKHWPAYKPKYHSSENPECQLMLHLIKLIEQDPTKYIERKVRKRMPSKLDEVFTPIMDIKLANYYRNSGIFRKDDWDKLLSLLSSLASRPITKQEAIARIAILNTAIEAKAKILPANEQAAYLKEHLILKSFYKKHRRVKKQDRILLQNKSTSLVEVQKEHLICTCGSCLVTCLEP